MTHMVRMAAMAAALALGATAAQAQGALRMQVSAETDTGGAEPACLLRFRLTNGGADRISTFSAEIRAVHAQTGAELRMPTTTVPFIGVAAGQAKDWNVGAVSGARCEAVRLQVVRMTCVRRCGPAAWTHQGLAAVEIVP